ncbi:MAG: FxDxF family PEP-CTERM protein [Rubrivivax sp.]|nr:FxDxF family PEP-CTERM protein [Rubrivivax sp.]MDP3083955.1 FxDxF family PEP-CTERM protein [Rubrivivax sp.]
MKLNQIVAAVALVGLGSVGSLAVAVTPLGTLNPSASFSNTVSGSFLDVWSFNFATPSIVGASVTNVEVSFGSFSAGGISNFAAWLNGTPLNLSTSTQNSPPITVKTQVLAGAASLPAGSYQLQVSGTVIGGSASYGGNIVATPIPEPETYALMLAGIGAIGFVVARRKARA